jgi:hypothetical protein
MRTVLPKKWSLKITEENIEILGKWRTAGNGLSEHTINQYINNRSEPRFLGYVDPDSNGYEEITWDEFQVLVLKTKPQEPNYEIY